MNSVLLVDDEKRMLDLLELSLSKENFFCKKAESGEEALNQMKLATFSLVLLDIHMPEMDGWTLCAEIRKSSDIPIIMVTGCADKADIVKGFQLGADDYITKPFHRGELLARIDAVLRRIQSKNEIEIDGLHWNEDCFKLSYFKEPIKLTAKEFLLLGHFMKNPNQVFSREQLINFVWEYASVTDERTVDSHVQNIREKIRKSGFPINGYLKTIWGVGYQWAN